MSLYENIQCPVCKNDFVDGDDIVVCPICGTPHHRNCYNMIGHCVNQGLHESGYSFKKELKEKVKKIEGQNAPQKQETNVYYQPDSQNQSEDEQEAQPMFFAPVKEDEKFKDDKSTIDGVKVNDIANVVRVNPEYFIRRFKRIEDTKKSANWNGSAFIFGSLYLFYRKMFKEALVFFALIVSIFYGSNALIFKLAPNFTQSILDLSTSSLSGVYPTQEQIHSIMNASDAKTAVLITYVAIGIVLFLHLIIGIFANKMYKKTVETIIKKTDEQLDENGDFSKPRIMITDSNIPKDQLRKMFFARRGGVSFFAPAMVLLLFLLVV